MVKYFSTFSDESRVLSCWYEHVLNFLTGQVAWSGLPYAPWTSCYISCLQLVIAYKPFYNVFLRKKSVNAHTFLTTYCLLTCLYTSGRSEQTSHLCVFVLFNVQKNQRELAKMRKCLRPEELVSHMGQMDTQTQHEELEKSYQVVVEDYRRIIERLASQAWSDSEMLLAWSPPSQHTSGLSCLYKAHITTDCSYNQEEKLLM